MDIVRVLDRVRGLLLSGGDGHRLRLQVADGALEAVNGLGVLRGGLLGCCGCLGLLRGLLRSLLSRHL